MGNAPTKTEDGNVKVMEPHKIDSSDSSSVNIIENNDFSHGLKFWNPNWCHGSVVTSESAGKYALLKHRTCSWQGLEQDITSKISPKATYSVSALVGVSGTISCPTYVLATLKLEFDCSTNYLFIGRTKVCKGNWEKVEGTFSLSTMPKRVVFYLEGPPLGADILINSVEIKRFMDSTDVCNILVDSVEIRHSSLDEPEMSRKSVAMPESVPEPKISLKLKLLVDTRGDRVVYAEAGKDFVDFLLNLLSDQPAGTSISNMSSQYIITDDLEVEPMSTITSIKILNKFNINDIEVLDEKVVYVGMDQGVQMLKVSCRSKSVLTDVFLGKKASTVSVCDVD